LSAVEQVDAMSVRAQASAQLGYPICGRGSGRSTGTYDVSW